MVIGRFREGTAELVLGVIPLEHPEHQLPDPTIVPRGDLREVRPRVAYPGELDGRHRRPISLLPFVGVPVPFALPVTDEQQERLKPELFTQGCGLMLELLVELLLRL